MVDGLVEPPVILRPGGISIESLRTCYGWEKVVVGYKDGAEGGIPRAPGMKYRHYSPRAKVILVDGPLTPDLMSRFQDDGGGSIGVVSTKKWKDSSGWLNGHITAETEASRTPTAETTHAPDTTTEDQTPPNASPSPSPPQTIPIPTPTSTHSQIHLKPSNDASATAASATDIWTVALGPGMAEIAHGLFAALRDLDGRGVRVIFVESVGDEEGDEAAAVMNRLKKAAEVEVEA